MDHQGSYAIADPDPLKHSKNAGLAEGVPGKAIRGVVYEGEPVHQETEQEDDQASFEDPGCYLPGRHTGELTHGEGHRITHSKQETGEDQVSGGETMPGRMFQGRERTGACARCVDHDHQAYGHAPQDVQRQKPWSLGHLERLYTYIDLFPINFTPFPSEDD